MEENKVVQSGDKSVAHIKKFPNSYEAEQSVLCCLLIDGDASTEYVMKINPECFYNKLNRKIFDAMVDLYKSNATIDIITVNDQLEKNGDHDCMNYLSDLVSLLPSGANCGQYVKIIYRDMILRRIIKECNVIIEDAYKSTDEDKTLRYAEKLIYDISKEHDTTELIHIRQSAAQLLNRMDAMAKDKNAFKGIQTGFPKFDKITNGLQKGDLIILAARPSVGKTAFALNIIANIAKRKEEKRVIAFYSLEMPAIHIAQRILSNIANIDMGQLSSGELVGNSYKNLWEMTKVLSESRIFINDSSMIGPGDILTQCRRLSSANRDVNGIDLLVVDYLGLMTLGGAAENRQQEISTMSREMKKIAKELNCPIILLCQMSRDITKREDKTPLLSDLRESGSIEQDADIVLFLSREDEKNKESAILLDIAKHRNGKLDQIRLDWAGNFGRFTESANQMKYIPKQPKKTYGSSDGESNDSTIND